MARAAGKNETIEACHDNNDDDADEDTDDDANNNTDEPWAPLGVNY